MTLVRPPAVDVPEGVCLQCFNAQQRLTFPFVVYCEHRESLAVVRAPHESTSLPCNPKQLRAVLAKLSAGKLTDALPPSRNGL